MKIALNRNFALWMFVGMIGFMVATLLVPGMLVKKIPKTQATSKPSVQSAENTRAAEKPVLIPVYRSQTHKVESLPLEDYVRGVVAAEMPLEFEVEALKAQAIAARTYLIRRLEDHDFSSVPVKEAWITDTVAHQAFISEDELRVKWSAEEQAAYFTKLSRAVEETKGQIITYEGKPIQAFFFSTSNGFTENSEDYWGDYIPYLRSVPSPWDRNSPEYKQTTSLSIGHVLQSLGTGSAIPASAHSFGMKVLEKSQGQRIKKINIAGKVFTGREVREKLGLPSSHFDWSWKGSSLIVTSYGYGHGVGMSQWGANGMAKEGRTAEQIVRYYYAGVEIGQAPPLAALIGS